MTEQSEDTNVNVTLERGRLNLWNIYLALAQVCAMIIGGTIIYVNMQRDVEDAKKEMVELREQAKDIEGQLQPLDLFEDRLSRNEEVDRRQEERLNQLYQIFSDKLDAINENVSSVKADVRVLAQKIESSVERPKPTTLMP